MDVEDWLTAGTSPSRDWPWQPARRFTLEQFAKRSVSELARLQRQTADAKAELAELKGTLARGRQAIEELHEQRRRLAVVGRR